MNRYSTHPVTGETWDEIPPALQQDTAPDLAELDLADVEDEVPGEDLEAEAPEERAPRYRIQYTRTTGYAWWLRLFGWTASVYVLFHVPGVAAFLIWFFFSYLL